MQGQGGGASVWSVAVHWVHWPWVSWVVQAKVSPHLCFAWVHPSWAIKQSEKVATCAVLIDFQAKSSCETNLAAASAWTGDTEASFCLFDWI